MSFKIKHSGSTDASPREAVPDLQAPGAFRDFIERHQERVRNICYRFLDSVEDAEEIAQDVFVEVYRSLERFRGDSSLSTWVYRIAVTKSIDSLRKRRRIKRFGTIKMMLGLAEVENQVAAPDNCNPERALEDKQRREILQQALDSLPENQRVAITLIKYEDLSYKDVATVMGLSVPAVEALVHRAKLGLQRNLTRGFEKIL
ncbi:RNA polymerase sigma factor [bacterium]|nr:RNA polymerase sigma factor [bacterium]